MPSRVREFSDLHEAANAADRQTDICMKPAGTIASMHLIKEQRRLARISKISAKMHTHTQQLKQLCLPCTCGSLQGQPVQASRRYRAAARSEKRRRCVTMAAATLVAEEPQLRPDANGRFGKFGGKYVPETLIAALAELEEAYAQAQADPDFQVKPVRYVCKAVRYVRMTLTPPCKDDCTAQLQCDNNGQDVYA